MCVIPYRRLHLKEKEKCGKFEMIRKFSNFSFRIVCECKNVEWKSVWNFAFIFDVKLCYRNCNILIIKLNNAPYMQGNECLKFLLLLKSNCYFPRGVNDSTNNEKHYMENRHHCPQLRNKIKIYRKTRLIESLPPQRGKSKMIFKEN